MVSRLAVSKKGPKVSPRPGSARSGKGKKKVSAKAVLELTFEERLARILSADPIESFVDFEEMGFDSRGFSHHSFKYEITPGKTFFYVEYDGPSSLEDELRELIDWWKPLSLHTIDGY